MSKKEVMKQLRNDIGKMKYYGSVSYGGVYLEEFTKQELIEIATFLGNLSMQKD